MGDILMGIDLGTSSLKTILIDPSGNLLGSAAAEYPVVTPHPGWAEQNPDDWYQAAVKTIRQAVGQAGISGGDIAGIGLSGQMHGLVCADREGRALRPAIIWADQRSKDQVEKVYDLIGREQLAIWTENPLAAGFMLPSWLWVRDHEPETARKTPHLLLPKDYLRLLLTGEYLAEPSDASSTALFTPSQREWTSPLLEALQIDPSLLPPLRSSEQVAGGLSAAVAQAAGLKAGTPVIVGGSDQACQAVGHGVIDPGKVSCTIGTGGQLFAPLAEPVFDPKLRLHLFCHVLPDRWHLEAAILSAGLSLRWLRDQLMTGKNYQELADLAAQAPPGAEGLFFLPYLAGERTPHMDPTARGAFIGLTLRHSQAHLVRAVMEGVVFALRQGLDLMVSLGAPLEEIIASGGGTRHPLWLQLQANIFNRPVKTSRGATAGQVEAAALGAAILAGTGSGVYPDLRTGMHQVVHPESETVDPEPDLAAFYQERYEQFVRIYPELKSSLTGS